MDLSETSWRKSSHSNPSGNCVEIQTLRADSITKATEGYRVAIEAVTLSKSLGGGESSRANRQWASGRVPQRPLH